MRKLTLQAYASAYQRCRTLFKKQLQECSRALQGYLGCKVTSPTKKRPAPQDPPWTLGIGLRQGPRGVRFFASEVPLYKNPELNNTHRMGGLRVVDFAHKRLILHTRVAHKGLHLAFRQPACTCEETNTDRCSTKVLKVL